MFQKDIEVETIAFRTRGNDSHVRFAFTTIHPTALPFFFPSSTLLVLIVAIALLHNLMRSSMTFKVAENCTCKFARKKGKKRMQIHLVTLEMRPFG